MALSFNEQVLDAMVRHQIGLLRFSGHLRNEIWKLLDATEVDIRSQVANRLRRGVGRGLVPANLIRMERLIEGLRTTRARAWGDVSKLMFEEMRTFAVAEPKFMGGILSTVIPVQLGLQLPDAAALRNIVTSSPFQGRTLKQHLAHVAAADIARIEQQVRIGMVQGEHPNAISRRIVGTVRLRGRNGVTQVSRNWATAIARTVVNGVGAEARRKLAEANKDIAPQELFTATLDSRTTPICRSLDGNVYDVGTGPVLPLHMGERSLYSPIIDGQVIGERPIRNFTKRQLLREYADANGLKRVTKRQLLPTGHKGAFDRFARGRMRDLTGVVPAKTTYTQFLNRQSAAFQDDILGRTRGALFRRGGLSLDRFVDSTGREIPLRDLAQFEAKAFRAAGFDPQDFLSVAA